MFNWAYAFCFYLSVKLLLRRKMKTFANVAVVVWLILACATFGRTASDSQICKQKGSVPLNTIMAIGLLSQSTHLMVVTKADILGDQYVYELPVTSLAEDSQKLFLSATPLTVAQKWPALHSSDLYKTAVLNHALYSGFFASDSKGSYLLLNPPDKSGIPGVAYDIDNGVTQSGINYQGTDAKQAVISSSGLNNFYIIRISNGKMQMCKYIFAKDTVMESVKLQHAVNRAPNNTFRTICNADSAGGSNGANGSKVTNAPESSSSSIKLTPKNGTCAHPLNLDVMDGFVSGGTFYIFGGKSVYIFSESLYTSSQTVQMKTLPYTDFFQCMAGAIATKSNATKMGLIIAGVLLLLILLLCLLLWCVREIAQRRRKEKKRSKLRPERKSQRSGKSHKSMKCTYLGRGASFVRSTRSGGVNHGPNRLSSAQSARSGAVSQGAGRLSMAQRQSNQRLSTTQQNSTAQRMSWTRAAGEKAFRCTKLSTGRGPSHMPTARSAPAGHHKVQLTRG